MTLFIKDSLPGKNTKAWQPLLSLLVLLILFRWYHQPLSPWVGTGKVGSLFLGLDNQPRVDSQRGSPVSYCVQETSLSFCPWGRCLTFCQSPLPTQCTKLNCLPPPPQESASSGCKTLTVRVLQLWEEAQGDLFSVHSSPVGLECVPQQTFFHWNGLAQSWAGRSNPLGPSLHA